MPTTTDERARESRLRSRAKTRGYALYKSRLRGPSHASGYGGWRIVEANHNIVVVGENFDLTLDDVERFFAD